MDRQRIKECEKDYLKAALVLDDLEKEFAEEVLRQRALGNVYAPKEAAMTEIGPYFNKCKADIHIAKLRLENAWREQGE